MSVQEKNESIPQPSGKSRLWTFLNSSFGLFVLSSIVLSFMTWAYKGVSHSIEQRTVTTASVTKLKTEMSYRIRLIENYFESECSEVSNLSVQTFVDIRDIYRAEPKYQSIFPENKQKDLHILLWELAALLDDDAQDVIDGLHLFRSRSNPRSKAFFVSFNSMMNFNAYLNRLNNQTVADGSFYGKPVDFKKEVAELRQKFSAATQPIANELPGVVTSTTLTQSSIASPSVALHPGVSGLTITSDPDTEISNRSLLDKETNNVGEVGAPTPPRRPMTPQPLTGLTGADSGATRGGTDSLSPGSRVLDKPFLLPIQDVFAIPGRGTVVTGRVERGKVKVGEEVEIVGFKPPTKTVVTSIEIVRKLLDKGQASDNVGIVLRGTKREEVERGQVLAKPGTIKPHTKFKGTVHMLSKEEGGHHTPFFNGYRPQFYIRTTEVTGTLRLPEGVEMVMPDDNTTISGELMVPVALEAGTRFDIREGGRTVGSGTITEIVE